MPKYTVTDPDSGASLVIEGDSPPSEQELSDIFKAHSDRNLATLGPWLQRTDIPQPEPSTPITARQKNLVEIERLREEDPGGWARNLEAGGIVPGFLQSGQKAIGETLQGAAALTEMGPVTFPGVPPSKFESDLAYKRAERTPEQFRTDLERNPIYIAGQAVAQTAPEVHPVPPKAEGALPTRVAETAGGFLPLVASGELAPVTIGLQSVGEHLSADYDAAKQQGKSDNEAADVAMNKALGSGVTQAAIWSILPKFLRNVTDDWIVDRFAPAVGTQAVKRFLVGRAANVAETGATGAVSAGTEAAIEAQPVIPAAAQGAAGLGVLGLVTPRGPTPFEAEARQAFLGEPGQTLPPEVKAWAQTFGYGVGEPVTAIRRPQAVVRPTQPYVAPEPGPIGVIPPLEQSTSATSVEQKRDLNVAPLPQTPVPVGDVMAVGAQNLQVPEASVAPVSVPVVDVKSVNVPETAPLASDLPSAAQAGEETSHPVDSLSVQAAVPDASVLATAKDPLKPSDFGATGDDLAAEFARLPLDARERAILLFPSTTAKEVAGKPATASYAFTFNGTTFEPTGLAAIDLPLSSPGIFPRELLSADRASVHDFLSQLTTNEKGFYNAFTGRDKRKDFAQELPRTSAGENVPSNIEEVRQRESAQADDRNRAQSAAEGQTTAPPSNELLTVAVRAPESPTGKLNKLGDPMGTTYHATPEDWTLWQEIQTRMRAAMRSGDQTALSAAFKDNEDLKNKYGGMPPAPPKPYVQPKPGSLVGQRVAPPLVAEAPTTFGTTGPAGIDTDSQIIILNLGYSPGELNRMTPEQAADIVANRRRQVRNMTQEFRDQGRALLDQVNVLSRDRLLTGEDRRAISREINNVQLGDYVGMRELLPRLEERPPKPPPIRSTGITRFNEESQQLREQIGEEDILEWIHRNHRMLSRNGARKWWGSERYEQNKSEWDDMPGDLPMHHQMAIYAVRGSSPSTVAQAAFDEHLIDAPTASSLWAAINQASRTRRGAEGETGREEAQINREEQEQIAWEEATRQAAGKLPVTTEEIGPGYVLEVGGERLAASEPNEQGDVTLTGSKKFGRERILREGQTIHVDAIQPPEQQGEASFEPGAADSLPIPKVPAPLPKGIPMRSAGGVETEPHHFTFPAPEAPEAPKPVKFGGAAPVGTIIDGYIKADTDKGPRWFKLDDEGNRRNLPPANAKKHAALEESAARPPAPPETRTSAQVLSAAKRVKIKGPSGATFIRVTDSNGRSSQMSIRDVNDGENVFQGVDIARIEAGSINRQNKFQPIEGDVTVEDVGRTARMSAPVEAETPAPLPVADVERHLQETFGVQPGGVVAVVNNPGSESRGDAYMRSTTGSINGPYELTKIELNAAKLSTPEQISQTFEHELAHGAAEQIRPVLDSITDDERAAIIKDISEHPYTASEYKIEEEARAVTLLVNAWKSRNWFEKGVGAVLAWAHKLGLPLTRLAAERIAARAIADQLTFIKRGSVINQPAVERVVHSLALNPKDWNMKQFFDTIGLQAATIGGYLHRYTRQVENADRLDVSDRARALDGMNQAREMTELAQGMGGRANYYDAVRDATTQGERNEVLRSAFESVTRYQQSGVKLREKLAERRSEIQSASFRNKLERAARSRDRAELAQEVRQTYTLQVAASAGKIMQTLNNLRIVGGAHEQLQADLTRLQQMPQFDRAVQQHFDAIVNALAGSDRGVSLLLGGGDRTGNDIWDEYLRQRFAANQGIPQGNEFTLGQLAANVLAANRDLRNQFGSLALLARDIITAQEWNRAASKIAQELQNDPVKAVPRILQRAAKLGEREGRAEAAFLTLNRGIQRTLRDYNDYEQAVQLHDAVEQDAEYRGWVNDVLQNPAVQGLSVPVGVQARMEGKPQPFFRYSGQDTLYSPDGKPYQINLQFTPENVQATMADLINLNADISDWLDRPENGNDPARLYWQERQRLLSGVLQSAAIWNPGAIESLLTRSSFGIPENLFQGLALPSAKLAFNAFKAFDRYFTQGKGWFGNNHDLSERAIQRAYKTQGFDELTRKAYQRGFLNAIAWEFRNGRDVRPGDIINGVTVKPEDLALLQSEGKMINDLYERLWKSGREAGAGGVMELPRIIDEFTGGAWGLRRPMEIGIHANTTLPHSFSSHGEALANQIHSLITARNNELTKLPGRVVAEGMDEAAQNAARAEIYQRFHDSLALTLNDPDVFQNAVLGFMRQRAENWVKLDGLSPFEQHYRAITDLVSTGAHLSVGVTAAPRTVEEVLDWIHQRLPPEDEWSLAKVRAQWASEWEKLAKRFYKMHAESDTGIRISSDKRQTAFTQAFRQDLGPAYFYDYGWIDAGEMRRYSTDMAEFGFERLMESLRSLRQNMSEAMAELNAAAESRKPAIVKRTAEAYRQGKDFRDLQHLQQKALELDRLIAGMPKWIGANAVRAEGISLKGMSRFVSFMIGAALTGPRTAARISGISMGGSAWKMGIVFQQLGYGRLRSYPAAAASAITSAFRVGTATLLGWYHGGERGFVPGVPLRMLMNVPGAVKSAAAAQGSEKLYSVIESILRGTTDEQFAALGWWFDQKALGMTPDVALGSRVAGIMSASRTKGGVLSRPQNIPTGNISRALSAVKLAGSKPLAALEAFVAGTNVYLPGAFGYNITYDAVGRQAGWYIDMLAANARRTFDTYERLGQLDRFNFDNLTDPRNKLQPWEVLPSFVGRFRFVDPAKLPGWARPNSTNLQFARELFATSTDVDLQDLLLRYWKRLGQTPREQRGAVEFLAPEELDAARAQAAAEARARGIISRFVEQTHHAAPSNRPHQLQQAWPIQAILPFVGWSAQTLKLIDATLGRAAFSSEANGMTADTYSALLIAAGLTAVGVGAFAFIGGDLEARMIRQLDRVLHHKEGTVKTIDEAQDAKEAAEITLHNMTASIPMLNSTLNQLFGMTGYRGGNVGFQAFAFDKVNSMLTYARDVYRTHDLTHGLDRLTEANIPISETIIENTFERQGLQNNRNAVRVLQKLGPQDLVERRASLSIALPTEMTPYRQALLEAIGSGDQKLVAETYADFIQKATELGRPDPEKLARQMFSTLNPYRQAFGGVLTDQQRADTLAKASDAQRKMVETMEQNYSMAASTLGLTADFEKQEKAPPIQRSGAGAGGAGAISLPGRRGTAGIGRIGGGIRQISLSGPKPPRIHLPRLGGVRGGSASKGGRAAHPRLVHGRLSARSSKSRRISAGRRSRRRISLLA